MAKLTEIEVCYQSNYNGCSLVPNPQTDGQTVDFDQFEGGVHSSNVEKVCDTITIHAYDECGEHLGFYGDIDSLKEFCINAVKATFGAEIVVTFVVDSMST